MNNLVSIYGPGTDLFAIGGGLVLSFMVFTQIGYAGENERKFSSRKNPSEVEVLPRAFAHNDYHHSRPLFSALDRGFLFVEADLFLREDRLAVAHTSSGIDMDRTLESLYLDPLMKRVKKFDGVYPDSNRQFWLMLDLKSDGKTTWPHLLEKLKQYREMLAVVRDGELDPGPVRVVISGNRPKSLMRKQDPVYAGVDGRLSDLESDAPAWFMPWISDHWGSYFSWDGTGEMPDEEEEKLEKIVRLAHENGRMIRFWHTPETPQLWQKLITYDVDMIATDHLDDLQSFLMKQKK